MIRAIEDREFAPPAFALADRGENPTHHVVGLGPVVPGMMDPNEVAALALGEQVLAGSIEVVRDDFV